jgi:hypothetical protein
MDRILEAAQNDFEEGGYAPGTLGDLKEVSAVALYLRPNTIISGRSRRIPSAMFHQEYPKDPGDSGRSVNSKFPAKMERAIGKSLLQSCDAA